MKKKFPAWGTPIIFEAPKKLNRPDLWVYAQKKMVSIKCSNGTTCTFLAPKKVKELIKLLKSTL